MTRVTIGQQTLKPSLLNDHKCRVSEAFTCNGDVSLLVKHSRGESKSHTNKEKCDCNNQNLKSFSVKV